MRNCSLSNFGLSFFLMMIHSFFFVFLNNHFWTVSWIHYPSPVTFNTNSSSLPLELSSVFSLKHLCVSDSYSCYVLLPVLIPEAFAVMDLLSLFTCLFYHAIHCAWNKQFPLWHILEMTSQGCAFSKAISDLTPFFLYQFPSKYLSRI